MLRFWKDSILQITIWCVKQINKNRVKAEFKEMDVLKCSEISSRLEWIKIA